MTDFSQRTLLVGGVGVAFRELEYRVAAHDDLRPFGPLIAGHYTARHGLAALVQARAREARDDLDVVLFATPETAPPRERLPEYATPIPDKLTQWIGAPADRTRVKVAWSESSEWAREPLLIAAKLHEAVKELGAASPLDYGRIVFEVSAGLRHVALALYLAALHLRALDKSARAKVAIYYAEHNPVEGLLLGVDREEDVYGYNSNGRRIPPEEESTRAELRDLTTYFDLVEAVIGVQTLTHGGDFRGVGEILAARSLGEPPSVQEFLDAAQAGLDIEAGIAAATLCNERRTETGTVADLILRPVREEAEKWRLRIAAGPGPTIAKAEIVLDQEEIERQATIVEWMLAHGRLIEGSLLAREWVVSRLLLARARAAGREGARADEWLDYGTRHMVAWRLAKSDPATDPNSAEAATALQENWQKMTAARNPLAHAGRCPATVEPSAAGFKALWQSVRNAPDAAFVALDRPPRKEGRK